MARFRAELLAEKLKARHLTQVALAKKLGVGRQYISGVIAGRFEPSDAVVTKLTKVLDVSKPDWFTTEAQGIPATKDDIDMLRAEIVAARNDLAIALGIFLGELP